MRKLLKVIAIFIIALFGIFFLGKLTTDGGLSALSLRLSELGILPVVIQLIVIVVITYIYPKFIRWRMDSKLQKEGITVDDLPEENRKMINLLSNRWVCLLVLLLIFGVAHL